MNKILFPVLVIGFLMIGQTLNAQEVYFSISGKNVTFDSGDRIGQYDYWFRPVPGVEEPRPAVVEIFDAGLGGFSDVISGLPSTRTTYTLYSFSQLYELGEHSVHERMDINHTSFKNRLTAFTENRFLNRWVPFFQLEPNIEAPSEGFIMRVNTDDGNDANNFRIRITGEGSEDWQLITMNLSIGLFDSNPENRFQIRPLWDDSPVPQFQLSGEEDSEVFIVDAFGERVPVRQSWEQFETHKYGKENYWAIEMTGSEIRINNRVLRGLNKIVPFYFEPVTMNADDLEPPEVNQIPGPDCNSMTLEAGSRSLYLNTREAVWQVKDLQKTGERFVHDFEDYGSYPYTLLVPTRGIHVPRYLIQEGEILINAPPVAVLNNFARVISPGESITLDASGSYDPEGRNLHYQWIVNGSIRSNSDELVFSSTVSGQYEINLILDDMQPNSICTQTTEKFTIRVNTQPYAEIDYRNVISKDDYYAIDVFNDSDADGDSLLFSWSVEGEDAVQTGRRATVRHEEPGTYTIHLTADDQTGTRNAIYNTSATYKVNAAPVPSFDLENIVAPGQPVVLDGSPSMDPDDDPLFYKWELSDGRTFEGVEHLIEFDKPGLYSVRLVVDDGENVANSVQTLSREIRVNEAPVPIITALEHTNTPIVRFNAAESYDNDQEIVSYLWDFGDGSTASGVNVTHTYDSFGSYIVRLTVDDGTGVPNSIQSTEQSILINLNPIAEINAPSMVSTGQEVLLNGTNSQDIDGDITSYTWFVNGSEIGDGPELRYSFSKPGMYSVQLKVRDDSPFDDAYGITSHNIRVNHSPVAAWRSMPDVTEPNRLTVFDASESFDFDNESLQYRWEFNDGLTLEGERVEREFEQPGTYYFTLYVDDGENLANSISSADGSIRVNLSPIIVTETYIRSNSREVLLDASESYDPDGDQVRYSWVLPDGTTRHESAFIWAAPEHGVYEVNLQVDDLEGLDNSISSERIVVQINRPPVAVVDARMESCTGQLIIFSSARSYDPDDDSFTTHWDFGDGNFSNEANPVHSYENPGVYNVKISLDDGFADTPTVQEIPVIIEGSPIARIAESEMTVCANSPVLFDGSQSSDPNGMVGSFSWDFGDGNSAVGEQTTHLFTRPGTYRVVLTITGSGTGRCPNVSQAISTVQVIESPSAFFEIPSVISPGTELTLDALSSEAADNIIRKEWSIFKDDEHIERLEGGLQNFTPDESGHYRIMLTITTDNEVGCGQNSLTRLLHVNRKPEITWNLPEIWPQHSFFQLSADGSIDHDGFIDSYQWYFNGEMIGSGLNIPLPVDQFGVFDVELVVRDDSNVENSEVRKSGNMIIKPTPNPDFVLPDTIYRGETVHLSPTATQDEIGNPLVSNWMVNGEPFTETAFTVTEPLYEITLIQSDTLNLVNSEAIKRKVLQVQQPLVPNPELPYAILMNQSLTETDLNLPDSIVIVHSDGDRITDTWMPDSSGEGVIRLGWMPRDEVLETFEFTIPVLEPLAVKESEIRLQIPFNPLNNRVEVVAPDVNRNDYYSLTYRWIDPDTGRELDLGKIGFLETAAGENRFELMISDDERIKGSSDFQIPVIILAE